MRKFALPRSATLITGLSALSLLLLAGCEGTGAPAPSYYHYKEYLTKPHYRAYVTTGVGSGSVSWSSSRYSSAEQAVEVGLKSCSDFRSESVEWQTGTAECYLHSIGNINVSAMNEEQLKKAIDLYNNNPDATNADLSLTGEKGKAKQTAKKVVLTSAFDGEWEGIMRCGNCEGCIGSIEKHVNIKIESGKFSIVPDTTYMGEGTIDEHGNMGIRWKREAYAWGAPTRRIFSFDGKYKGDSFELRGQRGPRTCKITLSRVKSS